MRQPHSHACGISLLSMISALACGGGGGDGGTPPGPTTGTIKISIISTGNSIGSTGYVIRLDADTVFPVPSTANIELADKEPGNYSVALDNIPSNCSTTSTNPQTAAVPAGGSASVSFVVACLRVIKNQIVFDSRTSAPQNLGPADIYLISPSGGGFTQLTNNLADDREPSVSPDGRQVAFVSDRTGQLRLYVMDADGGPATLLTPDMNNCSHPRWSPDGTHILFSGGNAQELFTIRPDGQGGVDSSANFGVGTSGAWSPDGSQIVFNNSGLRVVNADGSNPVPIPNTVASDVYPAWSPDGQWIVFQSGRDGYPQIYIVQPNGTGLLRLTTTASFELVPAWSPDGSKIVFESDRLGARELYIMNSDGSNQTRLTTLNRMTENPEWHR